MASAILGAFASLYGPFIDVGERIHNFQQKRKRIHEAKDQLVDALDAELKNYQMLHDHFGQVSKEKLIPALHQVGDDPGPTQMLRVLDSFSDVPKLYTESIKCFIDLAKACNEVSGREAFMGSLREGSNFSYDFVRTMSDAYVAKNTVRIDGRFFRFFRLYKKDILKAYKKAYGSFTLSDEDKAEIELLRKRAITFVRNLDRHFIDRHLRNTAIRRWRVSIVKLNKVAEAISIEEVSRFNMDDFIPPQIRPYTTFSDELHSLYVHRFHGLHRSFSS